MGAREATRVISRRDSQETTGGEGKNANDQLSEEIAAVRSNPMMRRDRTLFMFLFAITLISLLVVAVAWHYAALNPEAREKRCDGGFEYQPLVFTLMLSNGNWTLTSACTNKAIHLSEVTITIWTGNGAIANPMHSVVLTNLSQANWSTYHVSYLMVGSEDYVRQSARFIIDATWYLSGYRFQMVDYSTIIYSVILD